MDTRTILDVKGMSCGSCVHHVGEALEHLDGVQQVEVDLARGKVAVRHDDARAPVAGLIEAVIDAGYDATAA